MQVERVSEFHEVWYHQSYANGVPYPFPENGWYWWDIRQQSPRGPYPTREAAIARVNEIK